MANTRELSQLASVITVADETTNVGIGTTTPTSKLHVVGDVSVSGIVTATSFVGNGANLTGVATITNASGTVKIGIGTTTLLVEGNARVTGILTVGSSSITLNGSTNVINVGTGLTLSSSGINVTGVITATSFSGNGSGLTGVSAGIGTTGSINTSGIITSTSVVVSAGTTALPSISPTGDSNTGIFFPSADTIAFSEGGTEALRVDSSGRLLVGTSNARSNFFNQASGFETGIQLEGTTYNNSALSLTTNQNDVSGPFFVLAKTNGTAVGSNTIVTAGYTLGTISFQGADGSELVEGARIRVEVDGTPGANDMPGRLVFSVTGDGSASTTEAMRINNQREVLIGTTTRNANGGVLQLSSGITFPATAVAATDVNTLDDYEEGTWTPVVKFGGASVGITGTFTGTYTKIGNIINVYFLIVFTSKGSSTGTMEVTGLPFASAFNYKANSGFAYVHRLAALQTSGQMFAADVNSSLYFLFVGYNGADASFFSNTTVSNTSEIKGSIIYV